MNLITIPFKESQLAEITRQIENLNPEQIIWLSGYLEGRFARTSTNIYTNGSANGAAIVTQPATATKTKLTILFGTDTGRSKALAEKLLEKAAALNISAKPLSSASTPQNCPTASTN